MNETTITGYIPGAVGKITELHAVYYHDRWGFDVSFETQVGAELSDFVRNFQTGRDGLWLAWQGKHFAGSIAVDGRPVEPGSARLRWFILEPFSQGEGLGRQLIGSALSFSRAAGFRRLYLWTFRGLDAALGLYRQSGFTLTEEHTVAQWGQTIREQRFDLALR